MTANEARETSKRDWSEVTKDDPCPACGKPDWCAWTREGWLKCERTTETPHGMALVSLKDKGAIFRPNGNGARKLARTAGPGGKCDGSTPTRTMFSYASHLDAIEALERQRGKASGVWLYHDSGGEPVGAVLRWDSDGGKKDIRPLSLRDGRWEVRAMAKPRPLYRLPEIAAIRDATIFVVEGEACADAACMLGLSGTTSVRGASGASETDWTPMRGRDVVILPDHDPQGERYASEVSRLVLAAGARRVRIVRLRAIWPAMPEGGDILDLLEHRGGDKDSVRAEVEALANRTEPESPLLDVATAHPMFDPQGLFPEGAGYARSFLLAVSRSTQTPPEMAALLSLAVASGCICNVVRVRGYGDHIEPAPIWAMSLSEPAARKSAVLGELLAPVVAWEKRRAAELAPEIAAAAQRRNIEDRRRKNLEEQAAKEADPRKRSALTEQATTLAQEIAANPIPTAPLLLSSEPTPEALSQQMVANCGRALLASAEADALDIIQGRYTGGVHNYGILLKGHAGDPVRAHRVGRPSVSIDRPAVSVALSVQPQAVRSLWQNEDAAGRGLLARFAVIAPPDRIGSRDVRPPPVPECDRLYWRRAIGRLLEFEASDDPFIVGLNPDADRLYLDFQTRTEWALGHGDLADCTAWGGKLCGLALRFALTLHALGTWAVAGRPADFPEINAETMRAAIAWADYLAAAERHARGLLHETEDERDRRKLLHWIASHGNVVTVRELQRGPRAFRERGAAEAALRELVELGLAAVEWDAHGPEGGCPVERFRLVTGTSDYGDGDRTSQKPKDSRGCVAVATGAAPGDQGDWGEVP